MRLNHLVVNLSYFCFLIKGSPNETTSSSSKTNVENQEGSGINPNNHENVLDMETKNNISMTKTLASKSLNSFLSTMPVCQNIPT